MKAAHPDEHTLFHLAAEHSPIAMGLTDPEGRYLVVNDALVNLLGRDREQLLITSWQSLTHPDDLATSLATHQRLLEGQCDHYRLTKRYFHVDGRVVWGDLTVSAVRETGGPIRAALFQVVDITAMVHSRQQLADERERFRLLAEFGCDLVVMLDPNLKAVWISSNSEGRNCLGWPAEAEQGVTLDQRVHPDDLPRVAELTAALLASGQWPDDCLLRMKTAFGGYRWMVVKAAPVRGPSGEITGYVSGLRDVDELVRTRQQAEVERQRLQATLDSLLDPHALIEAVHDHEGTVVDFRYVDANAMACQAVGVPLEKLLGARVLPLVPALRDPELFRRYVHTLESGEPLVIDNIVACEGEGRPLATYDVRAVKLGDGLVVAWRDVSEREAERDPRSAHLQQRRTGGAPRSRWHRALGLPLPALPARLAAPGVARPARQRVPRPRRRLSRLPGLAPTAAGRRVADLPRSHPPATGPCTGWRATSPPTAISRAPSVAWCSPAA
jgi:PAS domain S-box-containing protein